MVMHQFLWSSHDKITHHKRRYSLKGFRHVLEQSGYKVQKISYYNMWLFPIALIIRVFQNTFQPDKVSEISIPFKILNSLLTFVFASERYLLSFANLPFGLSIVAVCYKDE